MSMKISYLFLYLLSFYFFGCNKGQSSSSAPAAKKFSYTISYDSTITVYANSTYNFPFTINVTSGDISQNQLTCSVSGLPAGITVSPSSMTVSYLKSGVFLFTFGNVLPGTYAATFTINSFQAGIQTHNLWLNVIPPKDYGPLLAGTYTGSFDYCTPPGPGGHYTSAVTVDSAYRIKISNISQLGSGFIVKALLSNVVTIPLQTVDTVKIWGSGTFTTNAGGQYLMTINDTLVTGLDTQSCVEHIQH